jgi:alkylation response protein AidB-like acyl-CoA dehydrogenase
MSDEHGQRAMEIARDLIGADAMLTGSREGEKTLRSRSWYSGYMFSRALTIGGGTGEVQRNILGEKVLGLPAEPDESITRPWSGVARGTARGVH